MIGSHVVDVVNLDELVLGSNRIDIKRNTAVVAA